MTEVLGKSTVENKDTKDLANRVVFSAKIEKNKNIKKDDVLAVMIEKQFGMPRSTFRVYNKSWLVKMSGASSRNEYNNNTGVYNEKIAKKISNNEIESLQNYTEALDAFSPDKQECINNLIAEGEFTKAEVEIYISNLMPGKIRALDKSFKNTLQFASFLKREIAGSKEATQYMKNIQTNSNIENKTIEIMANMKYLNDLQNRIDAFVDKDPGLKGKYQLTANKDGFLNKAIEKNYLENITRLKKQNPLAYKKLEDDHGGKLGAEKYLRAQFFLENTYKPEQYAKLTKQQKAELAGITQDFYTYSQGLGMDTAAFGLGEIYSKTLDYFKETAQGDPTYKTLVASASSNETVVDYFQNNKLDKLVKKDTKDTAYYKKLLLWHPEFDKDLSSSEQKTLSSSIVYFTDDLKIDKEKIKNLSSAEQENLKKIEKKMQAATDLSEESLTNRTNTIVQDTAIENCIAMLQTYMDVDITEKENIKNQLVLEGEKKDMMGKDTKKNPIVKIHGNMNGTKLNLAYNLGTGKVFCQNALNRPKNSEKGDLHINDDGSEDNEVPLITLPALANFTDAAKNMDYKSIVANSESLDAYTKNVRNTLQGSVKIDAQRDMKTAKESLKDTILKNSIMQKIFALLGRPTDMDKEISKQHSPEIHGFYNYLYNSLSYSYADLEKFRDNIAALQNIRNGSGVDVGALEKDVNTDESSLKITNPERFVTKTIVNQKNIPQTNANRNNQQPETALMSLFSCFERKVSGLPIIDMAMFDEYVRTAQGGNAENCLRRKRNNPKFVKLLNDTQTDLSQNQATEDLDEQLKMV